MRPLKSRKNTAPMTLDQLFCTPLLRPTHSGGRTYIYRLHNVFDFKVFQPVTPVHPDSSEISVSANWKRRGALKPD